MNAHEPDRNPEASSKKNLLLQFFIYPLVLASGAVIVFVFFQWMTRDSRSAAELVDDIAEYRGRARLQTAHELGMRISRNEDLRDDPNLEGKALDLFDILRRRVDETGGEILAGEMPMLGYAAQLLGILAPEGTGERLIAALEIDDDALRIQVVQAIVTADVEEALPALDPLLESQDAGVRKVVVHALARLGGEAVVPALLPMLHDEVADVRWNAAIGLAYLGSDAGRNVLLEILDYDRTAGILGAQWKAEQSVGRIWYDTPFVRATEETTHDERVAHVVIGAITAVVRIDATPFRESLERLRDRDDISPKIRNAAIAALAEMENG